MDLVPLTCDNGSPVLNLYFLSTNQFICLPVVIYRVGLLRASSAGTGTVDREVCGTGGSPLFLHLFP